MASDWSPEYYHPEEHFRTFDISSFSDITIACQLSKWKVHRLLMANASEFFEKACQGEFKEKAEGEIELPEQHPAAVHAMIRYIYSGDYAEDVKAPHHDLSSMMFHVHVFAAADYCRILALKQLACKKFREVARKNWQDPQFFLCIQHTYTYIPKNDDSFHTTLLDIASKHVEDLMAISTFTEILAAIPDFNNDLMLATARQQHRNLGLFQYSCLSCDNWGQSAIWMPYINEGETRHCNMCGSADDWKIHTDNGISWKGNKCGHMMLKSQSCDGTEHIHCYTCWIRQYWYLPNGDQAP